MNKTILLTLTAAAISIVTATGCKSSSLSNTAPDTSESTTGRTESTTGTTGKVTSRTYDIKDFSGITSNGGMRIHFTQGDIYRVKITGEEDLLKGITVGKQGDNLDIHMDKSYLANIAFTDDNVEININNGNNNIKKRKIQKLDVYVTAPHLENVHLRDVCSISGTMLKASAFRAVLDGVSSMRIDSIKSTTVSVISNGACSFKASLEADNAQIDSNGAGHVDIKYRGETLRLNNTGAASITADVDCRKVDGSNGGAGKITLTGTADDTNIKSSGVAKTDFNGLNQL